MAGKNGFGRLRVIDNKLRNGHCTWEDLARTCQSTLSLPQMPSKRTIVYDIEYIRDNFEAPIPKGKPTYKYTDDKFSIFDSPLSIEQVRDLENAFSILRRSGQLSVFESLSARFYLPKAMKPSEKVVNPQSFIEFERVDIVEGMRFLSPLYHALLDESAIEMTYQPFKKPAPSTIIFHPYYLKEFNQRWWVFGWHEADNKLQNCALDRIKNISRSTLVYRPNTIDFDDYFKHIIGVSRQENTAIETVQLRFTKHRAPYVETKPIHATQRKIAENTEGSIFEYNLILNQELEAKILEFGKDVAVLAPMDLKITIAKILHEACNEYRDIRL